MDWKRIRRHRHFKLGITGGVVIASVLSIVVPHLTHEIVIVNALTNLVWVWEDTLEG